MEFVLCHTKLGFKPNNIAFLLLVFEDSIRLQYQLLVGDFCFTVTRNYHAMDFAGMRNYIDGEDDVVNIGTKIFTKDVERGYTFWDGRVTLDAFPFSRPILALLVLAISLW